MSWRTVGLFFLGMAWFSFTSLGQNDTLSQILLKASQGFSSSGSVSSVALTGQVTRTVGPDSENGTITLSASADGSSSVKMQLGAGTLSEAQDTFANGQACSWSGTDGVLHAASGHNCIVPLAWFLPEVSFFSGQMPANGALSTGTEPGEKSLSLHWAQTPPAGVTPDQTSLLAHIGAYDLSLDASSFLPASLSYAVHPDDNAGVDIPISVRYSNYRVVDGVNVPFHIERYFNGVLQLDITISNASINH